MTPSFRSNSLFALQIALVFGLYVVLARWGLALEAINAFAAFIWPPTGLAIAAVYLLGYRIAPAIIFGALLVNYLTGAPFFVALTIGAGNAIEAIVAVWLLHSLRFSPLFNRMVDSFIFIAVALSATIVSATIGVSALTLSPLLELQDVPLTWLAWWIGDVLGALIVAPFLLRWFRRPSRIISDTRTQFLESVAFLAALIIASVFIFWDPLPQLRDAPAYLLFVPLTWGALRVGPRMVTIGIATLAAIAAVGTFSGTGPFAPVASVADLFGLQLFLATVAFIFLLFVAAVEERKEGSRRLEARVVSLREDVETISESDRAKNDFIATLSHELRNPLAPILSSLEIMRTKGGGDTTALVETAYENVLRMTRLLDDLLDVARISRKKFSLQMSDTQLKNILTHAASMARPLIEKRHHTLVIEEPIADVQLHADPLRIEQVLVNLLNNAAKYTPDGGTIKVAVRTDRDFAEIRIRDNGIGIPRDELQRIFEPFRQAGNRADSDSGLGIGLSLAKRLVELHGGTIKAESAGPGRGSEFIVRIPIANVVILLPEAQGKAATPSAPTPRSRKEIRSVLVVDDNEAAAHAIAKLLNHSGHDAKVAHDGAGALATLASFRPDIILLDIGLPDRSGYDLARTIRDYLDPQPYIVALTGYGQEEDKLRALEAGCDAHLTKPVSIADLEKVLAATT